MTFAPYFASERAQLLQGDNLEILHTLAREPSVCGHVSLAYIDPPYGTGRDFGAFDDRWEGGRHALVDFLEPRLIAIRTLLADEGSLLVHIDQRIAHVVAVRLDALFGPGDRDPRGGTPRPGFRSEIIWTYGLGGSSSRVYPRKHDTILWYTKGSHWHFEAPTMPARSIRMRGKAKKQLDVFVGPPRVDDLDTPSSIILSDVWDVAALNNMAKERTGYPTRKPLALLRRLVRAHSREGDLVLDAFCGSGTTLVAALEERRRGLGIDLGDESMRISAARLRAIP